MTIKYLLLKIKPNHVGQWQGRFKSYILEGIFLCAIRYIELNPIRARVVGANGHLPFGRGAALVCT